MNSAPLRVLIVEDSPTDAELLELNLVEGGYVPSAYRVDTARAMQAALETGEWDLVISDYAMPQFTGLEALEVLKATGRDIPFILISGSAGEDVAVGAMKAGAHDFFVKGRLGLFPSAVRRELREAELRATARTQREQLERNEKLAALGTLLAGVAHELNNPLTVILHQATLLQRVLEGDPRQARAGKILQAVGGCSRIVKNFLALARQQPPRRVAVSINDVVDAALDLVSYDSRKESIEVRLDLLRPMPNVSADPQQLEQVLINLMSNAQYALRSRAAPRILTIATAVDAPAARVVLRVTDNAGGIRPEIRSRIFDPFFTTKPIGEGTGLGLALCHGIVTAHDGTIAVSSETDAGTTFTISLPIDATEAEQREDGDATAASSTPSQRILVVDDEPVVAAALSEILTFQGHQVDEALTGRRALELIENGEYDIVVTDMSMPDLDGPALYREVVARHPHLGKSFLFVTGDAFSSETDRFLAETGVVHLSKPCTLAELETALQQVLRGRG